MSTSRLAELFRRSRGDGVALAGDATLAEPDAAQRRLEAILQSVADAITVQDASGRLLFANAAAARMLGYASPEELMAATDEERLAAFELLDDDGRPLARDRLPGRRVLAGEEMVEEVIQYRVRATGECRWSIVRASAIRDTDGRVEFSINTFHDISERVLAERRLAFLANASGVLSASLDWEGTLGALARLAVPTLADWCIVDVLESDGRFRRVAVAASDPAKEGALTRTRERYAPTLDSPQPAGRALRERRTVHFPSFTAESLAETVYDAEHLRLMQELDPKAAIAVPLIARGHVVGAITLASAESGRRYAASDVELAEELARRAALAVDNARLYRAEQEARERVSLLAEAGRVLGSSLDYEQTLKNVADLTVPALADWCVVDMATEDRRLRRLAVAHVDPHKVALAWELEHRYPMRMDEPSGPPNVLRTGEPELLPEIPDELLVEAARDDEHLRILREVGFQSYMAVPMKAPRAGRVLGVITFVSTRPGLRYGDGELALADELASRAAIAIENALFFRDAQEAAATLRFVSESSALLAASLDYETTLRQVADLAVPRLGETCMIDVLEPDDRTRVVAVAHVDRAHEADLLSLRQAYPPAGDAHPVRVAMKTGRPQLLPELPEEQLRRVARDERHAELLRELYNRPGFVVPLIARERTLGAFTVLLPLDAPPPTEDDLRLGQEIGRRAATAIDNARLYDAAQSAARVARETAALLDTLFATAPVGLAYLDRELRYIRINDALAAVNGVPRDEHIGKSVHEVVPDLAQELAETWNEILATGEPVVDTELSGRTPGTGDEIAHWLSSYYPVRGETGEIVGIGAVVVDITERKRTEENRQFMAEASTILASSLDYETTLRRVAELAVPRLADWCTIDMVREDGSLQRLAVAHVDPAKIALAHELEDRFQPDPQAPYGVPNVVRTARSELFTEIPDTLLEEAVEGNEELLGILRELGLKSSMCVPLVARGRTLGAITFISETEGRRFTELELELAEELARRAAIAVDNARLFWEAERRADASRVLEYVGDGVFMLDREGVVRLWNPAAATTTGVAAAEVVGRRRADVVPGWGDVAEQIPVAAAPAAAASRAQTVPLQLPDRELWLSVSGVGFGDGTVYAFRDLTEERALEELRSDFVSTVSHELRTPLAAIYGAALTLRRRELELSEEQRDNLLGVVGTEADRLARTVNDILWASRLDSDTLHVAPESCDSKQMVRDVVAAALAHLPANVELVTEVADDASPVMGDPDKVRQVLVNLVDNAVKYSPDGGRVIVRVEPEERLVRFSVADEGLGIPQSEQRRIFDKFYRLDPQMTRGVGGTGLGLYICRELIRRMGGRIWVESREGEGSTFTFELPVEGA